MALFDWFIIIGAILIYIAGIRYSMWVSSMIVIMYIHITEGTLCIPDIKDKYIRFMNSFPEEKKLSAIDLILSWITVISVIVNNRDIIIRYFNMSMEFKAKANDKK